MAYANNRIHLNPRDAAENPEREIVVGWDRGMQTYFAQVFDGTDEFGEDLMAVDIGMRVGEITYPGGVIDAVRNYAEIPDELGQILADQREADTSTYSELRSEAGHIGRLASLGFIDLAQAFPSDSVVHVTVDDVERTQLSHSDDDGDGLSGGEDLGRGMGY